MNDDNGRPATAPGSLTAEQVARLNKASAATPPYPYYPYERQEGFARSNPPVVRSEDAAV